MAATSIQWCDHSINPLRARHKATGKVGHYCEKIASGCKFCYSSSLQRRFGTPEFGGGQLLDEYELYLDETKLDEVRRRKKPTRYFWCDMTDIFGHWVKPEWLAKCFAAMDDTPQHTHMLLTKRPENVRRMWPRYTYDACLTGDCPHDTQSECDAAGGVFDRENVWLLTSVSDQPTADAAIPELLKCRDLVPVLGVSYEPALGPVDFTHIPYGEHNMNALRGYGGWDKPWWDYKLDLVIFGGESGPQARPCDVAWARSTVQQCAAANVACFVKQLGANVWDWDQYADGLGGITGGGGDRRYFTEDKKGGDVSEWPEGLAVRQFPKILDRALAK